MSFLSKADFKTKQQWLKKQRKELMKRQSLKYHEFNSQPNHNKKIKQQNTLAHMLTSQSDTSNTLQPHFSKVQKPFKNDSEAELYKSMTERLIVKEQEMTKQRQIIRSMESQLQLVRTENALMRGVQSAANELLQGKRNIEQQNSRLRVRYAEMEHYLNMNGVIWQQNRLIGELQINNIKQKISQSKHNCRTPKQEQFQTLIQRIAELNESLRNEMGESKYVNIDGVYKLQKIHEITLTFYKNGVVFGNTFYSYDSKEAMRSMQDLQQGYYPYLFKTQYPDGVVMNVVGQLDIFYPLAPHIQVHPTAAKWFKGKYHSLSED